MLRCLFYNPNFAFRALFLIVRTFGLTTNFFKTYGTKWFKFFEFSITVTIQYYAAQTKKRSWKK